MTSRNELLNMSPGASFTEASHLSEVDAGVDFERATIYVKVFKDLQTNTPLKPWKARQFRELLAQAPAMRAMLERLCACATPGSLDEGRAFIEARALLDKLDAIDPKTETTP